MYPEDLFKKLRPLNKKKIDQLWIQHILEDQKGKREIEQFLELTSAKILQDTYQRNKILLPPISRQASTGNYTIGQVYYGDLSLFPFSFREQEFIQHIAVFGRSGAGKTNFIYRIIQTLMQNNKPFLVFDWKRNYRDLLKIFPKDSVKIYTIGRDISPFKFNPLIPPPGTKPTIWLKKIIEILAHAYFIGEGVMHHLQNGIDTVYQRCGVYAHDKPDYPVMKDILNYLETLPVKGRRALWMDSVFRVLSSLTFGETGKVLNTKQQIDIAALLNNNVILELDALVNSDKTFIIEALLLWIHHYRLSEGKREEFKHAIIIEEAHHVLLKKKQEYFGGETVTDIILREIRELGESIILVDQHPSLISLPALGNSHSTICFNLKHRSDVSTIAKATLLDINQENYLGMLDIGYAIVKLQTRYYQPFLVRIPLIKLDKGIVTDEEIKSLSKGYFTYSIPKTETGNKQEVIPLIPHKVKYKQEPLEQALITDIIDHPFAKVIQRYSRLGLSSRKGNEIQNTLLTKGLIKTAFICTSKGRIKLLELTENAATFPPTKITKKHGGLVHRYWVNKIAEYYSQLNYKVRKEYKINGSVVDILAIRAKERIVIEIETGKSNFISNIEKLAMHNITKIISVATTNQAFRQIKLSLKKHKLNINIPIIIKIAKDYS